MGTTKGNEQWLLEDDGWDETLAEININFGEVVEAPLARGKRSHTYRFKNVEIQFPYAAYTSQLQMMEKIIDGVTTGQNCLLESPTGTGKTAALLCSLLAWQRDCYNRGDNCSKIIEASVEKMGGCTCGLIKDEDKTKVLLIEKKGVIYLTAITPTEHEVHETSIDCDMERSLLQSPSTSTKVTIPVKMTPNKTASLESPKPTLPPTQVLVQESFSPASTKAQVDIQEVATQSPGPETPVKTVKSAPQTPSRSQNRKSYSADNNETPTKKSKLFQNENPFLETRSLEDVCAYCVRKNVHDKSRPPKIYYCTRTHSQIAQVVKQLKDTPYSKTAMTILTSREPTCISQKVQNELLRGQEQSKKNPDQQSGTGTPVPQLQPRIVMNDACIEMKKNYYRRKKLKENDTIQLDEKNLQLREEKFPVCKYFAPPPELERIFTPMQTRGAWDLEDIKKEGEGCQKCPYYGCYSLHKRSDIVFCPYNYLIYPDLRMATAVEYVNSILVFDEAHNIEDICRDALSIMLDTTYLDKNIRPLVDNLLSKCTDPHPKTFFKAATKAALNQLSINLGNWSRWIRTKGNKIRPDLNDHSKNLDVYESFEGDELLNILKDMNLTVGTISECMMLLTLGKSEEGDEEGEVEYYVDNHGRQHPFKLSSLVKDFLNGMKQKLPNLFRSEVDGIGGIADFRGFLTRTVNPEYISWKKNQKSVNKDSKATASPYEEFFFKFQIICLNPALGFRTLKNTTFSIIVASGTLTPLDSFAGELSCSFPIKLQANHVIPPENVWAGVVSVGPAPKCLPLELIKRFQDDTDVQDDIGKIICEICFTVPNGILVFLPSYSLMRKLNERWRAHPRGNNVFDRIRKRKMIFFEESKNKSVFKRDMEKYKEEVKGGITWDGCILFAVFRGKISEGIDFADEQARAVITIGIPYSNLGSPEVVSKKKYNNDKKRSKRGNTEMLLSGSEWYTTQAFRAINQGFGRCVRHLNDWGALILIDSRLGRKQNQPYISGWVQKNIQVHDNFEEMKQKLKKFIQLMKNKEKLKSRQPVKIEYEQGEDLECTELVPFPEDDDELFTQIVQGISSQDEAEAVTQFMSTPMRTSTPVSPKPSGLSLPMSPCLVSPSVPESSPEYSFNAEIEELLGSPIVPPNPQPPALVPPQSQSLMEMEIGNSNNSSPDLFERTRSGSSSKRNSKESIHDSDLELSRIADMIEGSENGSNSQRNGSGILDVSMQSISGESNNECLEISQGSNISYHSDSE